MIFLIQYDRRAGRILSMESFGDEERGKAQELLLSLELKQNQNGTNNEVVLLEAASEKALRLTHRHYFEDLSELLKPSPELLESLFNSR